MEEDIVFMRSAKAGSVTVDSISVEHVDKADQCYWHLQYTEYS